MAKEVINYRMMADDLTFDSDAEFIDAAKGDFRLRSDSAVYRTLSGFRSIPFDAIGLQVDECRQRK